MKKLNKKKFYLSISLFILFIVWTVLLCFIDVKTIGPNKTGVGFARINLFVHELTGVNMTLYKITDLLSIIPLGIAMGFALMGLVQWIKRKKLYFPVILEI